MATQKITLASIVNKVKTMFADEIVEETVTEMAEATVVDSGILVRAESWEVGKPVVAVIDGNEEIMPAGSFVLDNGATLVIAEDGTIAEVMEPEVEVEAAKPEGAPQDMSAYVTQESFTATVAELTKALERVSTKLSAMTPPAKPDVEKLQADNKSLAIKLAEKRKAIADKAEPKKDPLPANFGKTDRGHRSGVKDAVSKRFKDFNFTIEKTNEKVEI
jgi:hypothetical protein